MTTRSILLASALMLFASLPASAAGDNVVLIDVSKVRLPSDLPGLCQVNGTIGQVLDGKAFHRGQSISLKVPCSAGNSFMTPVDTPPGREPRFIAANVLLKSKQGMAHLDDTGALIWQHSRRSYDGVGDVTGYRVLDGTLMPAVPDRLSP